MIFLKKILVEIISIMSRLSLQNFIQKFKLEVGVMIDVM